jgi:anti-anti-sigma factor
MSIIKRSVRVHQVPEKVTSTNEQSFLRDLQKFAESERPRFVLDCSRVYDMDIATIRLLLSCLEEAMKCNGDVRLASLRPKAEEQLRMAGVSRLFEVYSTSDSAIQSFHQRPTSNAPMEMEAEAFSQDSGLAA